MWNKQYNVPPQGGEVEATENGNNQVTQSTDWIELGNKPSLLIQSFCSKCWSSLSLITLNRHIWTNCAALATDFHEEAVSHHTVSIYYIS